MGRMVRDDIIQKTAEELDLPVDLVHKIVMNQFKQINAATQVYNEIEVSGVGKFIQSQNKIDRRIRSLEKIIAFNEKKLEKATTQEDVIAATTKMEECKADVDFYKERVKPRTYETKRNIRRVEESPDTTGEAEGGD